MCVTLPCTVEATRKDRKTARDVIFVTPSSHFPTYIHYTLPSEKYINYLKRSYDIRGRGEGARVYSHTHNPISFPKSHLQVMEKSPTNASSWASKE